MNYSTAFVSMKDIINQIKSLVVARNTGSLYLLTPTGDSGVIVMDGGVVVDVVYKSVQGTAALPQLCRVQKAKSFFKNGRTDEVEVAAAKHSSLSYGQTLFSMFERDLRNTDPLATKAEKTQSVQKEAFSSSRKNKKILVVEDSRVARIMLCKFLQEQGYDVLEASNGRYALSHLAVYSPDLVILDLILPDIDGYEVFREMKGNELTRNIPVIILTSRDSLVDKLKGRMSGSDEYVTKPFKNETLLEKLNKHLDRK